MQIRFSILRATAFLLAFAIWNSTAAAQQPLTPLQFRSEIEARLRVLLPDREIGPGEDSLTLTIGPPGGRAGKIFLDNTYADYRSGRASLDGIAARFAEGQKDSEQQTVSVPPLQRDRVIPLVRNEQYAEGMKKQKVDVYIEPIAGDLVLLYVEDGKSDMRFLSRKEVTGDGGDPAAFRNTALENLRRILPEPQTGQAQGFRAFATPSGYGGSHVLLPAFWESVQTQISGEPVFAVPERDVILVADSRNRRGIEAMMLTLRSAAAKPRAYSVSDRLYVYRNGKIEAFTP